MPYSPVIIPLAIRLMFLPKSNREMAFSVLLAVVKRPERMGVIADIGARNPLKKPRGPSCLKVLRQIWVADLPPAPIYIRT